MATLCGVICLSHTPFLYTTTEEWEYGRALRAERGLIDPSVPVDAPAELARKRARIDAGLAALRAAFARARPDVVVVFGDDQREQFGFANFPAFAIFVGAEFAGYKHSRWPGVPIPRPRPEIPRSPETWTAVPGHPPLATALLTGLMARGFDLAFCRELPDAEEGLGHAFMRVPTFLAPSYDVPLVPIAVNCYFGPQPTARRCYELGRAVAELVAAYPEDLRVALVGSGGLWHTPRVPNSILDEAFDARVIESVRAGDAAGLAAYFDACVPRSADEASGGTGVVLGLGGGTGETRNWIAAAAAVDGMPGTVVDYVPIYASPIGVGFAYWEGAPC